MSLGTDDLSREGVRRPLGAARTVDVRALYDEHLVRGTIDEAALDPTHRRGARLRPMGAVLLGSASTALARAASCSIVVTPRETPFDLLW